MSIPADESVPLPQARSDLSAPAEQVEASVARVTINDGERCVPVIDAQRLDDQDSFARDRLHLLSISDGCAALADVSAGRLADGISVLEKRQRRRAAKG